MNRRTLRQLGAVAVLALVPAVAGCGVFGDEETREVTALFGKTVGVYPGSDVRILGVQVGTVTELEPEGEHVRVHMEYDEKFEVPADAHAVIVAPSIVADRYVQLTPAYTGGPILDDGALIPPERTEIPLELDEIYESLDELNRALGPNGANKEGALSDLLSVGADNLEGNGELLGSTLEDFSQAIDTLAGQSGDLFGTIRNLQEFTTTIANSDQTVRQFNRDLAVVADQLAAERGDLALAIRQLSVALGDIATFVGENRGLLESNVENLTGVTEALLKNVDALEELLDTAPASYGNLALAYNPASGTLDTRDNGPAQAEQFPLRLLCPLLSEPDNVVPVPPALDDALNELTQQCLEISEEVGVPHGASESDNPLPIPGAASASPLSQRPAPVPTDRSLAGLLLGVR